MPENAANELARLTGDSRGRFEIADVSIPAFEEQSIATDAVESATEAFAERLDKELHGAWRAGYDYVHVYDELPSGDPGETYTLRQYVFPSDVERPPRPPELQYRYTYDLASVSDAEIRAVVRKN